VIRAAVAGVWDFLVGDDWRIALGAVLILGAVAIVAALEVSAWWITPPGVLGVLYLSVSRGLRKAQT
jgi:hypothetical protein